MVAVLNVSQYMRQDGPWKRALKTKLEIYEVERLNHVVSTPPRRSGAQTARKLICRPR